MLCSRRSRDVVHISSAFSQSCAASVSEGSSALFRWMNPKNPSDVERRIGNIYWEGWSAFVLGVFLTGVGVTLLGLGVVCFFLTDTSRALVLLLGGAITTIPGVYSLVVLWLYACGHKDCTFDQLMGD
ncbi:putative Eukaryotic protein of unknown function (DUF872) [Trypanosoma vivax]|uniref:Transmembrane protein n=1 Tax=Trypanosoma vivax (strain Y486) TaxID=1055687 RepID=G0TX72_TRYVY|nr:hypothetical protein TRVL_00638 [Trypanosoma vivax]KAH8613880.1 putative Eukaryotic protein of unknown function (DUF872) [Trypanosoma vivax]CCC48562.1 conserved hypothetical protein [Trypanosoma vivax Y486]